MFLTKRSYKTINKYLLKEFVLSFMVGFTIFFALFLVNELLVIALRMQKKDVPVSTVILFLIYSLPYVLSYTFPLATMVSCLMAVGRFNSDNEILAMRASGIRYIHILKPFIVVAFILAFISYIMNDYFLPMGMEQRNVLLNKVALSHASVILEPYEVSDPINGRILITGDIEKNVIKNIVIIDRDQDSNRRTIVARNALFQQNEELEGIMNLKLENPFIISPNYKKRGSFNYIKADSANYNIVLKDYFGTSFSSSDPQTMPSIQVKELIDNEKLRISELKVGNKILMDRSFYDLQLYYQEFIEDNIHISNFKNLTFSKLIDKKNSFLNLKEKDISSRTLRRLQTEFHYKFVLPTGCIALIILAFPLGLFNKRSDKAIGLGIGSIFASIYWVLIMGAKIIGYSSETLNPVYIMWTPNLMVAIIGIIFYVIKLSRS